MELNIPTSLLALLVIVFVIGISFKRFFNRFPLPIPPGLLSPSSLHPIKELLLLLVTNRETQKRLFITVGVLIVFRLLAYIPLPGVDQKALAAFFHSAAGILDSGASSPRFSILSLGIMPFLSSCILLQLLSAVIPPLHRATFGGEKGRYKVVRYTYLFTLGLALVQAYGISVWLDTISGVHVATMPSVPFRIVATATLTAACFLLLFLADIVNNYGIGNGIAMLVISGFLLWGLKEIQRCWYLLHENMIGTPIVVLIAAIIIGSLYLAFFFTSRERKIVIGGKRGQKDFTIPLRPSWVADGIFY
jgi:preprotein translocase subunit SecY